MTQRKSAFVPGEFYHLYNRGNSRQKIFLTDADSNRFQQQLYLANSTKPFNMREINPADVFSFDRGDMLVHIGAYCLMPNHFHILLTPQHEIGVQIFMQKLATGYSMYFNKRYERTGGLFEGRFKSQHAHDDTYLKYLFSYIHLNPLKLEIPDWRVKGITDKGRATQFLEGYRYSSYPDQFATRSESKILERSTFPEFFYSEKDIRTEIFDWITLGEDLAKV